jgi:hypothetical protein
LGLRGDDQRQHVITSPAWDDAPLWSALADAGYGASAAFRRDLDARGLLRAGGIPRNPKVDSAAVQLVSWQRRVRKTVPSEEAVAAGRLTPHPPAAGNQECTCRPVRRGTYSGG